MNETKSLRKKKDPVSRTTISVPSSLKAKMDRFQLRYYVNWSQIAADAWTNYMANTEKENTRDNNKS